jgi:uncharacterized protein (DUF2336 family)
MSLTYEDVHQLIKEPSPRVRCNIAQKVAVSYGHSSFTQKSNKIALDILRLLLKDTEKQVRLVLAQELKYNAAAPRDVIMSLALDEIEIAEEVLQHSVVLQDSDLIELMNAEQDIRRLLAISRRPKISLPVSEMLVELRKPQIISSLLNNSGAELHDKSLHLIIEEFYQDASIVEALVCRGGISFVLAEKLYYLVSDRFKKMMTKRQLMPVKTAEKLAMDIRETMIVKFLSPWMTDEDLMTLVDQMYARRRLTDGLIIRALCHGELGFFEAAVAKRVGIPIVNARKLLKDDESGFGAIYRSSKLPVEYREAVKVMVSLVREQVKQNMHRSPDYAENMLGTIRSRHYDTAVQGMDYITSVLQLSSASSLRM